MRADAEFSCFLPLNLLFLCFAGVAFSQTPPFHVYTTRDGLPSNHITALLQDSRGYLWIGTDNGLSVYDGREFKNFSNKDGFSNLFVTHILESRTHPGVFWIGTIAGGIVKLENGRCTLFSARTYDIGRLYEDDTGSIWCSTSSGNFRTSGDTLVAVGAVEDPTPLIAGSGSSILFFGKSALSWYRPDGSLERKVRLDLPRKEFIATVLEDRDSTVWALSSAGLLLEIHGTRLAYHRLNLPFPVSPDIPSQMIDDGSGSLWITAPGGIAVVHKTDRSIRTVSDFGERITKLSGPILRDHEGTLWVGTFDDGLLKLAEQRIYRIPVDSVSTGWYNLAACSDSGGHIWISTETAIWEAVRVGKHVRKLYRHSNGANGRPFLSSAITIDTDNRLWVGEPDRKVFTCYAIAHRDDLPSILKPVMTIRREALSGTSPALTFAVDRLHRAWLSLRPSGVGLVDLNRNKLLGVYGVKEGLPPDLCRAILVDRSGTIWYGSWTSGISMAEVHHDALKIRETYAGGKGKGVRSLYEDRSGNIWIGTRYGGLLRYSGGRYTDISVRDGMLSNAVWSIAETDRRLWCGTDVGLESIDRQTGVPLPPKAELIGNRVYACGAYRNDVVWCVTAQGLLVYEDPERITVSPPPPVYIKSYTVSGIITAPDSLHEFNATQNSCTIEFIGISFKDEHKVLYRYRLLGLDSSWTGPTHEHSVTYASLQPGSFKFEVYAINADGASSIQPATISFSIVPPLWQRWWFVAGVVCASGLILYGLFRYRLYHLMALERLRLRIAGDLHDDVGTSLSSIILATQIIERQLERGSPQRSLLSELGGRAQLTQEMLKDIVWLLNPANDTFDEFILKLKDIARRQLVNVPFTFQVSGEEEFDRMGLDFRRNLVLFFKEAVTNVAKHADATAVDIALTLRDRHVSLVIHDNGRGFDAGVDYRGNGLKNLHRRAEQMKASVDICSAAGKGTTISLVSGMTYSRTVPPRRKSVS